MGRPLSGWFRVYSEILTDPRFMADDWRLSTFVRLLALLNRSEEKDGSLKLTYRALGLAMGRSRRDVALKRLFDLERDGLVIVVIDSAKTARLALEDSAKTAALHADYVEIIVPKYRERQGFVVREKCTTKTKTKTKTKKEKKSPPKAHVDGSQMPLMPGLIDTLPDFASQILTEDFYAAFALPAGNPAAIEYTPEDVAIWHAWMWSKGRLEKYKPRGMKRALKSCWWRSTEYKDEVQAAKNWLANLALIAGRPQAAPETPCDEPELELVFSDVVAK